MNNSVVFVTGINGFVGRNLKPYLASYFDIQGISRKGKLDELTYTMFLEENRPYDVIVHLAGKAHDLKKTSQDNDYYEVNFELTKQLYDQFLLSNAQQFIYVSSVKAAADEVKCVLTEEVTPNPITAYGKSKQMAEAYLLANLPANKKVYILRPCMIHGPGNKGNLNLLYHLVAKRLPWPLGAFDNQRSFLSIKNLCFVIQELLVQENIPSGVYNVADDETLSTNELIKLIGISQNKNVQIWNFPKIIVSFFAKIGDYLRLPLNSERLQKLTESYIVSNHKIKKALGIEKMPFTAKEGMRKTFESFQKISN
jgi:nucleoside-diphosphate-sugar epimerase